MNSGAAVQQHQRIGSYNSRPRLFIKTGKGKRTTILNNSRKAALALTSRAPPQGPDRSRFEV